MGGAGFFRFFSRSAQMLASDLYERSGLRFKSRLVQLNHIFHHQDPKRH